MQTFITQQRRSDLTIRPDGRIDISARVARILDMAKGDAINIAAEQGEYYLYISHRATRHTTSRFEATVFPTNRGGNNMRTYSRRLAALVLGACGSSNTVRLFTGELISHGDTDYLTIIMYPQER